MRDFSVGRDIHVNGNINITDESNNFKPLAFCSNEELFDEEIHRKSLLKSEQSNRSIKFLKLLAFAALLLFVAATWYWIQGKMDMFSLLIGASGMAAAFATIRFGDEPTSFEGRQIIALREIHNILRERGAR